MKKLSFFLMAMLVSLTSFAAALGEGYEKVTDISTLAAGDKVVLYADAISTGVTGWDGNKDAKVAADGWVEYLVEAGTSGGVLLKDSAAGKYIAMTTKNAFKYAATGTDCKVNKNGVIYSTKTGSDAGDYFLYQNGSYYRMYKDKSSDSSYKPFYMYKVVPVEVDPDATIYTVTVKSADETMGTVSGGGEYAEGKTATLEATPKAGYEFVKWSNESTDNPLKLTVTEDIELTATFQAQAPITIAEANKLANAATCVLKEFTVTYIYKSYIHIQDASGYGMIYKSNFGLNVGDVVTGFTCSKSTYNGLPQFVPTCAKADLTIVAGEAPAVAELTTAPTGNYHQVVKLMNLTMTGSFNTSSNTTVKATCPDGTTIDIFNGKNHTYTFVAGKTYNITGDVCQYSGKIQVSTYAIEEYVAPVVNHTIAVSANPAEAGTVTGAGEYEEGTEATLTATAAEGYEFVNWTVGDSIVSTENPYKFTVTADLALVANFKEVVKAIEVKVTDATATSGEWSIDLAGSWNDQALTIKLWQDNTQGFGSYAPNTETGYYILLGAKELTPTTEGVYADNGDGTFTFTCSATDGTTQYNITVTGNNPTQGGGDEVYQIIDDAITNLTFNLDEEPYSCMGGPSKTYGIELYLVLGEDDGMGTFTLTSESVIGVMGAPATFISGYLTDIDPSAPAANAVIVAKLPDGSTFEFHIAMSSTPVDATVIVVENATLAIDSAFLFNNPISGDVYEYSLTMSGNWTDSTNTTYLVTVEFPVYDPATTEEQERLANIKVGDFAADDAPYLGMVEDYLTITNVNGVITAQGIVSQNGLAFDLTISGTLSQGPSTGVENLNGTVAPVKVIENGQIFIIRNGVKYNAQGAQL